MHRFIVDLRRHPRPLKLLCARLLSPGGLCRLFKIRHPSFILKFFPSNLSERLWINPRERDEDLKIFFPHPP